MKSVRLEELLDAREKRVQTQKRLLEKHGCTLISFTLNILSQFKAFPLARSTFDVGVARIEAQVKPIEKGLNDKKTG